MKMVKLIWLVVFILCISAVLWGATHHVVTAAISAMMYVLCENEESG